MFDRPRIIPSLLIDNYKLVKTIKYQNPRYLGDPINAIKIFNEKEVDELCVLDITRNKNKRIDFEYLQKITSEAFMPLSYGGGIKTEEEAIELVRIGFEKVVINSAFASDPSILNKISASCGSQSVVASIDVKTDVFGRKRFYSQWGTKNEKISPLEMCKIAEASGAGELLVNSITNDGMMNGYDIDLLKEITDSVGIPVIACGGAGKISDLYDGAKQAHVSALCAGSMFVYYGKKKAVLINYPSEKEMREAGLYEVE